MTRSSGPSGGSYRQTVAAERAAAREREQYERRVEKERLAAETAGREEEAVAKTEAIGRRVFELENLLRSSLDRCLVASPRSGLVVADKAFAPLHEVLLHALAM